MTSDYSGDGGRYRHAEAWSVGPEMKKSASIIGDGVACGDDRGVRVGWAVAVGGRVRESMRTKKGVSAAELTHALIV